MAVRCCSAAGLAERHIPAHLPVASAVAPAQDPDGRRTGRFGRRRRRREPRRPCLVDGHGGPGSAGGPSGRTVVERRRRRGRGHSAVRRTAAAVIVVVGRFTDRRRRRAAAQDGARVGRRRWPGVEFDAAAAAGTRTKASHRVPLGAGRLQRRDGRAARRDLLPSASRRLLTPRPAASFLVYSRRLSH